MYPFLVIWVGEMQKASVFIPLFSLALPTDKLDTILEKSGVGSSFEQEKYRSFLRYGIAAFYSLFFAPGISGIHRLAVFQGRMAESICHFAADNGGRPGSPAGFSDV